MIQREESKVGLDWEWSGDWQARPLRLLIAVARAASTGALENGRSVTTRRFERPTRRWSSGCQRWWDARSSERPVVPDPRLKLTSADVATAQKETIGDGERNMWIVGGGPTGQFADVGAGRSHRFHRAGDIGCGVHLSWPAGSNPNA